MDINNAVKFFKKRLLSKSTSPYIMKIVLFGSSAKGQMRKDSDVDLLIISSNGQMARNDILDTAFELQMEYGVPLEILIEDLDDYIHPTYFLYNVLSYGKEVFSVDKKTLKKEAEANLLKLAIEYLNGAEELFKSGFFRLSIDAGYNAVELAIKAMLLRKIDDLPGSHGGIVGKFGEVYVKTKKSPAGIGRKLNLMLEMRNSARYKYQAIIKKDDAQELLEFAKDFIGKVNVRG